MTAAGEIKEGPRILKPIERKESDQPDSSILGNITKRHTHATWQRRVEDEKREKGITGSESIVDKAELKEKEAALGRSNLPTKVMDVFRGVVVMAQKAIGLK